MDRSARQESTFPVAAGLLFGLGLGGFFDGILLHQVLQWHHMLTSAGYPPDSVQNLQVNTLWDGFFHLSTYLCVLLGLLLASLAYKRFKLFYYASITDCTAENILNPIWLRGKEFPQAKAHLDTILTPETSTGIQSRRIHETLNDPAHMLKVAFAD